MENGLHRGARYLTGGSLEVVGADFSTLGLLLN